MDNNEREILVFDNADTCKTALEGIVRAHNALAYCWIFCFLTVSFREYTWVSLCIFAFYFFYSNLRS